MKVAVEDFGKRDFDLRAQRVAAKLLAYCRAHDWAGYDPYDALNSRWFEIFPALNSRLPRLAATQILKRSPWNFRGALLIPQTQNAKAIGLFLASLLQFERGTDAFEATLDDVLHDRERQIAYLLERLIALRAPDSRYWCWGYSFPWQGRNVLVAKGAANLVCTTFVADALLDAWERRRDAQCLGMAASAADYIRRELFWSEGERAGFAYPLPTARNSVHNANFLAAALLCRVAVHTGEKEFFTPALEVARYSTSRQNADGSWFYGEDATQRWIDNFHTGYNLCALRTILRETGSDEFERATHRGFEFYRQHFFLTDEVAGNGVAKYFHDRTYPIDVHAVAQSVITLVEFQDLDAGNISLATSVLEWALDRMWDEGGYFHYRLHRWGKDRTSYMRWSQAWMLRALASYVNRAVVASDPAEAHPAAALIGA